MNRWALIAPMAIASLVMAGCGRGSQTTGEGQPTPSTAKTTSTPRVSEKPPSPKSVREHTPFDPQNVDMLSPSEGWAWSQDAVWWTQDGGQQWDSETPRSVSPNDSITVQIVSPNVAWVAVATSATASFPVWVTRTHGDQWRKARRVPEDDGVPFVSALSADKAWLATNLVGASGSESMVLDRTDNGGMNWTMLPSSITAKMASHPNEHPKSRHPIPLYGDKSGVVFASPKEGFISGGRTGTHEERASLWRTIDGGNNWFPVALPARSGETLNWTFEPTFFNAEDGVMAVEVNSSELATYRTQNGGKTWSEGALLPFSTQMGWSYSSMDSGLYVAVTTNARGAVTAAKLYATSDGGRSFNRVAAKSLPLRHLRALDDVSSTLAFAVATKGGQSVLWKTTDGGREWHPLRH